MAVRKKVFRGDRLKQTREVQQFTQDELNQQLGFGNTQIHRYETGKAEPSLDALVRITIATGVTSDYLLGLAETPDNNLPASDLTLAEKQMITAYRSGDVQRVLCILIGQKPID